MYFRKHFSVQKGLHYSEIIPEGPIPAQFSRALLKKTGNSAEEYET